MDSQDGNGVIPVESKESKGSKVISDPVHNTIRLHPLMITIIDTREFQRLKQIQHLRPVSEVYPGATHTTFSHSLGVCYLAKLVGEAIQSRFNELKRKLRFYKRTFFLEGKIKYEDILCLQIAGLCLNLGQAPCHSAFSEVFKFQREKMSAKIFREIYRRHAEVFQSYGIDEPQMKLIVDMIEGKEKTSDLTRDEKRKFYLYQVVNNRVSGVDVAKWESLTRDAKMCALRSRFNYDRVINMAQVCETDEGFLEFCFRDKDADVVDSMFRTQNEVDHKIYKHKVVYGISEMYKDIFTEIKDLKIFSCKGSFLSPLAGTEETDAGTSLDEMSKDSEKFIFLDDTLFTLLLNGFPPEVQEVTKTLDRIRKRDFYRCLVEKHVSKSCTQPDEDMRRKLENCVDKNWKTTEGEKETKAKRKPFVKDIDFSSGKTAPRETLRFYSKKDLLKGEKYDTRLWDVGTTDVHIDIKYRVYYKGDKTSGKEDTDVLKIVVESLNRL